MNLLNAKKVMSCSLVTDTDGRAFVCRSLGSDSIRKKNTDGTWPVISDEEKRKLFEDMMARFCQQNETPDIVFEEEHTPWSCDRDRKIGYTGAVYELTLYKIICECESHKDDQIKEEKG